MRIATSVLTSKWLIGAVLLATFGVVGAAVPASGQVVPSSAEVKAYRGLFSAAATGDLTRTRRLLAEGADPNATDSYGRTPAHVAGHFKRRQTLALLLKNGADPNRLERDRYDVITIAAVANDPETISVALRYGGRATNVTSRFDGTALIAASHLGNIEAVRVLVRAGAPLNHINNLEWTALLEAIILGDGGSRHTAVVTTLVKAGADVDIADGNGVTPLAHARSRGYTKIVAILEAVGATTRAPT